MTTARGPLLAVVIAAFVGCMAPVAAWSEQAGQEARQAREVLDSLALPFATIPDPPEHAPVPPDDSTYRIGFSHTPRVGGFGVHADTREVEADLTTSYVWESSRFGQFILSTRATYIYDHQNLDGLKDSGSISVSGHPALTRVPELQSSLMFSWQSGNHQATATTQVASDEFRNIGDVDLQQLNELVGHIATLDLRYGYNIRSGRKSSTRISVGLRNTVDRRPLQQLRAIGGPQGGKVLDANGSVAYGTIKYQF